MQGQRLGAVLEVVGDRHHRPRELGGLADRDEAGAQGERDRGAEQEPASLDADHDVDVGRADADVSASTDAAKPPGEASSGVMSRNITPGWG